MRNHKTLLLSHSLMLYFELYTQDGNVLTWYISQGLSAEPWWRALPWVCVTSRILFFPLPLVCIHLSSLKFKLFKVNACLLNECFAFSCCLFPPRLSQLNSACPSFKSDFILKHGDQPLLEMSKFYTEGLNLPFLCNSVLSFPSSCLMYACEPLLVFC